MREAWIVARRELKGYFVSPIAYVFGVLFLVVQLWLSTAILRDGQQAGMEWFFQLLPIVFLVFLPALTMRLWSEERKLGTLELLMTFPVRIGELIAGKFAAALLFLALLLVLTLGLPLTMGAYGSLDWGPVAAAYLATLLMASSYVAVGMFFSSLTRDQIVALLLSIVFLGILSALGTPLIVLWLTMIGLPAWLTQVFTAISPYPYFLSISRGVIDVGDLVYYVAFCGFFLNANALVLAAKRRSG
jgi:ABC-2 type transport system permease protein